MLEGKSLNARVAEVLEREAGKRGRDGELQSLRGVAVGRKNHYGSRSERGTRVAALFYSLIESAKLCGVEPRAYLREAPCGPSGTRARSPSRATSSPRMPEKNQVIDPVRLIPRERARTYS